MDIFIAEEKDSKSNKQPPLCKDTLDDTRDVMVK